MKLDFERDKSEKKLSLPADCPETIIYVFLDGIGLGRYNTESNPFARFNSHFFSPLGGKASFPEDGVIIETDAHMGIKGLPQSATGQTALFTGHNGPEIMGRHVNGFPTYSLRPYLKQASLLKILRENGLRSTLLNSYSEMYLRRLQRPKFERLLSASSHMQISSEQPFFSLDDYQAGRSMYMDITNWFLRKHGFDIEPVKPKESGRKLVRIARDYNLVVYEYFFTDKTGHEQSMGMARRILPHIEGLLEGVWEELDPEKELFILSSDHGNFEDLSVKTHTNSKVGTIVYGKGQDSLIQNVKNLYDIPRQIMSMYGIDWHQLPVVEEAAS